MSPEQRASTPGSPLAEATAIAEVKADGETVLRLRQAGLSFGERVLWSGLDLDVHRGEFLAVLGANGSGKSSLLKVILGLMPASAGTVEFLGRQVRRGNRRIGYIPQQRLAADGTPARGRDVIGFGIDGHRWGVPWPSRHRREAVDSLVRDVGAERYSHAPVATLSGGEQQRVRIAQALTGDPALLLCDEPLLSLDLARQRMVSELVDRNRRTKNLGVLFVTHDINPILSMVDRVLYLANGQFRIGAPTEVLRSDVLSQMYGTQVDVIHTHGRVVVLGTPEDHSLAHHDAG